MALAWYNSLFGLDEESVRAGQEADRKLAALNKRALESGKYDAGTYAQAQKHLADSQLTDDTINAQIDDAIVEGLKEGYDNVTSSIKTVLDAPRKFLFASIPWYFWLLGAGAVFFYLGGGGLLKGVLKK